MTVLITLTTAGTDSGPFDLYSDLDGYLSAFESGVSKAALEAGYASSSVPDYTNIIRVKSNGVFCTNSINIPVGTTTSTTTSTTTTSLPVSNLIWETTSNTTNTPTCQPSGWLVSPNNLNIRYNISDSTNCGGTCNGTQTGTAIATITVNNADTYLDLSFTGVGELEAANFENIRFIIDGGTYLSVEVANAHAAGGGLGCQMGPVIQEYLEPSPYLLTANTVYTFTIEFTTADNLFQVGAFYDVTLLFI